MNIPFDALTSKTPTAEPSSPTAPAAPRSTQSAASPKPVASNEPPVSAPAATGLQADVTFRRDSNGRIYYVISDAQSGKEIQEVPAKAVRSVTEGIDEYLKQEQGKSHTPLNTKG